MTAIRVNATTKLIAMAHSDPVTMWEHHDKLCLEAEI